MIVRKIEVEEVDKLEKLFKHVNFEKYKNELIIDILKNIRYVYVIEDDEKIIGEITVYYKYKSEYETIENVRVYLSAYRVLKEYRGQGIGQALLKEVIKDIEKQGYTEITIGIETWNENALHIYNKFGFNEKIATLTDKDDNQKYEYDLLIRKNIKMKIEKLMKNNILCNEIQSIQSVTGGLMHKMYKVITERGIYAVKCLNNEIMSRKQAYHNFIFSEKVANIAVKNNISAIGALNINGEYISKIDNEYFMVFNWIDGVTLKKDEITKKHCEKIGRILANIHNISFKDIENEVSNESNIEIYNWKEYLNKSKENKKIYANDLEENVDLLIHINERAKQDEKYSNIKQVISHRDLDSKNVLWNNNNPYIIDWEASGYINPVIELLQVAWYWSGGNNLDIDYNKFKTVVNSYKENSKIIDTSIEKIIYVNIYNVLNWLRYNLERNLCIGYNYSNEEIELSEKEIIKAMNEIKYYINQIDKIIKIFK